MLMMSSSAYLFFESECSLGKIGSFATYLRFPFFVTARVLDDSRESAFKLTFLVRNGFVKGREIKGINACDMVEI